LTQRASTTFDTSEFHDGSLENAASKYTVEKANRILSDSVYEVEKMDSSYRLFRNSGEHVGTYQDVVEMAEDLVELVKGFDGMHGYFEKNRRTR
jgi:hypothetical protein